MIDSRQKPTYSGSNLKQRNFAVQEKRRLKKKFVFYFYKVICNVVLLKGLGGGFQIETCFLDKYLVSFLHRYLVSVISQ